MNLEIKNFNTGIALVGCRSWCKTGGIFSQAEQKSKQKNLFKKQSG
jgi:hypothetical protein